MSEQLVKYDLDKVLVVDAETSGVDPIENGLLSIGAVWLTDLGTTFYEEGHIDSARPINDKALEINGFTPHQCRDLTKRTEYALAHDFLCWVERIDKFPLKEIIIAGENPYFDRMFIQFRSECHHKIDEAGLLMYTTTGWESWPFSRRMLDLHSVAFSRYFMSLNHVQICEALLLSPEDKPHHALKGAMSEALCLRKFLGIDPIASREGSELWNDWDKKS